MQWVMLGMKLAPLIIGAVQAVEKLFKGSHGKDKQDAAVDLSRVMLGVIEGTAGRDLLDDAVVQEAVRKTIDAIVAMQNVIATRAKEQAAQP